MGVTVKQASGYNSKTLAEKRAILESKAQARIDARTKVTAANNPIERIYFTKGDRNYDYTGRKSDKRAGVFINGQIYWLKEKFTHLWELSNALEMLGISVADDGLWGFWEGNKAALRNGVIILNEEHKVIFSKQYKYYAQAALENGDSLWWSVKKVKEAIFDKIELKQQEIK